MRRPAESYHTFLGWEQEGFLEFNRVVDSLRGRMESYQDPEQDGVSKDVYSEYLESSESYNDSVSVRQDKDRRE
ncbi:MAG: hypothetical protein PVJ76_16255 [Gemmatimonadota bacterium]